MMENIYKLKILWFLGPIEYRYSGIGKYSEIFIKHLLNKKSIQYIKKVYVPYPAKSLRRYITQLLIWPIYSLIRSNYFDIAILYEERLFYLLPFIKNPVIIVHDSRVFEKFYKNKFKKNLFKLFFRKIPYVIVPSYFTKKALLELDSKIFNKIYVIPNPIDIKSDVIYNKEELFKTLGINNNEDKKILLYVGSEEPRKNVITLLKVMKMRKDWVLIKVGKAVCNKEREKHIKFIKENNLKNVIFIDYVDEKTLASLYKHSDVFVFPSIYEGFGRPPLEAQSMGLPVVSSRISALEEILGNSALYVENPFNEKEFIEKINLLLENKKLYEELKKKGIENSKRFNPAVLAEKFERILNEISKKKQ